MLSSLTMEALLPRCPCTMSQLLAVVTSLPCSKVHLTKVCRHRHLVGTITTPMNTEHHVNLVMSSHCLSAVRIQCVCICFNVVCCLTRFVTLSHPICIDHQPSSSLELRLMSVAVWGNVQNQPARMEDPHRVASDYGSIAPSKTRQFNTRNALNLASLAQCNYHLHCCHFKTR
jgi:uncharacterized membrane protein